MAERRKSKFVDIKTILQKIIRDNRFHGRVHEGELANLWNELFDGDMGQLIRRDGGTLVIRVSGSTMKYELENFRKHEILQTLHMHKEFSSINDLIFTEK